MPEWSAASPRARLTRADVGGWQNRRAATMRNGSPLESPFLCVVQSRPSTRRKSSSYSSFPRHREIEGEMYPYRQDSRRRGSRAPGAGREKARIYKA